MIELRPLQSRGDVGKRLSEPQIVRASLCQVCCQLEGISRGGGYNLKFSADFFNFTNTPSFASPTITDIHSAAAGATTLAPLTSEIGTPRLVQFNAALRVLARLARLIPG